MLCLYQLIVLLRRRLAGRILGHPGAPIWDALLASASCCHHLARRQVLFRLGQRSSSEAPWKQLLSQRSSAGSDTRMAFPHPTPPLPLWACLLLPSFVASGFLSRLSIDFAGLQMEKALSLSSPSRPPSPPARRARGSCFQGPWRARLRGQAWEPLRPRQRLSLPGWF